MRLPRWTESASGRRRVQIDVFTLFPEWFEWFEGQRHVGNALSAGHRLSYVNYRDHTPLSAGQVDDAPFGGGAGMVLRVDVVDTALRARYGADPVELRSQRRIVALTPSGRLLDDSAVDELVAAPELTLLTARYEARHSTGALPRMGGAGGPAIRPSRKHSLLATRAKPGACSCPRRSARIGRRQACAPLAAQI
jgi:tRNA (Guanine-1)-methyltransferase